MGKSSTIQAHTDKYTLLGALDPDTDEIKPLKAGDGTVLGLGVQLYVWDSSNLEWVKMQQPTIEAGDLYIALDDVEDKLDTSNTYLEAIKDAVEILDNIVSGSEAQVDIVSSALPSGAATEASLADQLLDYHLDDIDDDSDPSYFGYQDKGGKYIIVKITDSTGAVDYTRGDSGYATAWTNRASESYSDFASTF